MATQIEVTHALLRVVLGVTGNKQPDELRIPRPNDKKNEPVRLTGLQAAAALGAGGRRG